jgi:uncharacterized protein YcbX
MAGPTPSRVTALWRYPVKSAAGQPLRTAVLGAGDGGLGAGVVGDREWACIDAGDGTVGSAKHPRRWGGLLTVPAVFHDASGEVSLEVGGRRLTAGAPDTDAALGRLLDRPLRLTRTVPEAARLHRLLPADAAMVPQWMSERPGAELVTAVTGARPGGRFVDSGAVHIVTSGALARLATESGSASVAAERFRPNLVIDMADDPALGTELCIGDVVLRVLVPTPRCVVPSLEQVGVPTDPGVLRTLAAHHRIEVPGRGRAACFGSYAEVVHGGEIAVGQPVTA